MNLVVPDRFDVQLFGDFQVSHRGTEIDLPNSKKTRALLAYLIVTGRPQRRERLCELFWETSNDPKGALRWSLSQINRFGDAEGAGLIEADRERVAAPLGTIMTDLTAFELALEQSSALDVSMIERWIDRLNEGFLLGLELPNLDEYSAWLTSERARIDDLLTRPITLYLNHPDAPLEGKLRLAKQWLDKDRYSQAAASAFLGLLRDADRQTEFVAWTKTLRERFETAGLSFEHAQGYFTPSVSTATEDRDLLARQKIKFCKASDGVTLAYASVGDGPPLVKAANWLSHLELDWSAPIWSPLFRELARDFQFIRYDERGNGLSDWDIAELSQAVFVEDLEAIINEFDYPKVPLLGISQGVAVCIDYAVANPDRVSKLVLFGGYPKGWRIDATPEITAMREAMLTLTRDGWGQENPAYRNIFSATFMPTATPQQLDWFNNFQRNTTSPQNAVRFLEAFADIDVRDKLAQINVPTLVIHSRGDQRIDWAVGRDLAAAIPGAEFVTLESDNHLLLEGEAASQHFVGVVRDFLKS
ncbi:MAG: alpha/beta fold hydrolase [Pseudomonadota bacterium]